MPVHLSRLPLCIVSRVCVCERKKLANMSTVFSIPPYFIFWDAATCGGTLNYKLDEPTSFFSLSFHFFFFSSRLLCLVVSLSASSCASKGISYHVSVSRLALSATKRMAGKSLKCADVYKLRSKWKLYRWQWPMISKASPPAFSFLNLHCT